VPFCGCRRWRQLWLMAMAQKQVISFQPQLVVIMANQSRYLLLLSSISLNAQIILEWNA
jgi:hypothetical protein